MMEVMASIATAGGERAGGGHGIPFQRRNVQEWSRLDELTGMLEHARVETDHWAASTSNSSHHFGKVVDSRSRNLADGGLEQRQQTKQLEVFQASIPGGSLQVIRSQSVTSTSSSWHGQSKINTSSHWSSNGNKFLALPSSQNNKEFDNLKLPLNPLDLSSQKSKASVGRSGSIGSRRPPSRPRSIVGLRSDDVVISEEKDDSQLSQLSRICQKYHQEAKEVILTDSDTPSSKHRPLANGHSTYELDTNDSTGITNDNNSFRLTQLLEEKSQSSASEILKSSSESTITNSHPSLTSKKSCSIEDLHLSEGGEKMTENGDKNTDWRRSSKVRRSLQFTPKQNTAEKDNQIVSSSVSVSKIKQEIEARKQLVSNTLKCNQWNNLGQLEGVLGVLRNSVNSADTSNCKTQSNQDKDGKEQTNSTAPSNSPTKKRQTFITVESLKEVRGRLRKLNSPTDDDYSPKIEEVDDGIVTEPKSESPPPELKSEKVSKSSVKSFVYGMEAAIKSNKQPITGTGSLESRSSNKSNGGTSRSEEWYNRRKSYGFEPVSNQHINQTMSNDKNKVDSSTDSGICRSSETVTYPWSKIVNNDRTYESGKLKTSHNIVIKQAQDESSETNRNKITFEKDNETFIAQKGRKTVVTLGSSYNNNSSWNWNSNNNNNNNNNNDNVINEDGHKEIVRKGKIADALRSLREKSSLFETHRLSEPITISIPIQPLSRTESTDPKSLLLKQTKEPDKDLKKDYLAQSTQITTYSDLIYGKDSRTKEEFKEIDTKTFEKDSNTSKVVPWYNESSSSGGNWYGKTEMKRHSIAVDEAKYMNNSKAIGSYYIQDDTKSEDNSKTILQNNKHINGISTHVQNSSAAYPVPYSSDRDSNRLYSENDLDTSANEKKHKKVEFCKTEVHFAAESGRFNIVETDGKPPPSHNFRRRRRSNSETSHNTTGLPEIRFGDSQYEKNLLTGNDKDLEHENITDVNMKTLHYRGSPVFVDAEKDDQVIVAESNATIPSSNIKEDVIIDDENTRSNETQILVDDDIPKPRSILKNSIPKPRPFFLGEEIQITPKQDPDETKPWGVKLKTSETIQVQTNTAVITNTNNEPKETEFQKLLRSLRPTSHRNAEFPSSLPHVESSSTAEDNGLEVRITSSVPDQRRASWSVADRVRHVEELRTKGYSTKVNFGASETTVIDNKQPQQMKIIAPRQEVTEQPFINHNLIAKEEALVRDTGRIPQEASFIATGEEKTGKRLTYSQSFTGRTSASYEESKRITTNSFRSTSLVMQVQKPSLGNAFWSHGRNYISATNEQTKNNSVISRTVEYNSRTDFSKKCSSESIVTSRPSGNPFVQPTEIHQFYEKKRSENPLINVKFNPLYIEEYNDNTVSQNKELDLIKLTKITDTLESDEKDVIPSVLNQLDNLSRCIDEVIIDSPRQLSKVNNSHKNNITNINSSLVNHRTTNNVQPLENYEDKLFPHKTTNPLQKAYSVRKLVNKEPETNGLAVVPTQLDILKNLLDPGELSDDSLKADEEVRAYMSTGNEDEDDDTMSSELSGSWSKMRTFKHINQEINRKQAKQGAVAPTKQTQTSHHRTVATTMLQAYEPHQSQIQGVETLVSTHYGNPKITSISLRYNDELPVHKQQATVTAVHPKPVYTDYHVSNSTYGVQTNIKQYESGERIWTFTKSNHRSKRDISPEYKKQQVEYENRITAIQTKQTNESDVSHGLKSAKLLLTKSISLSKESLLNTQNSENGVILHSDNNYRDNDSALSPKYVPVSASVQCPEYKEIKSEKTQNKDPDYVNVQSDIKSHHSQTDHYESVSNNQVVNKMKKDRVVRHEQIKSQDIRKVQNDKSKERKLSTSSSGRDSWLNTPKDPQPRQRSDVQTKRYSHDMKRDKKVSETRTKSTIMKNVKKRSDSPIYQNGDVYSDRKEINDKTETESAILEELTKAADQILLAVNGYTDEESFRGSSDDEYNRRHSKEKIVSKPLCTISEMPTKKITNNVKNSNRISHTTVAKSTRSSEIRRDYISSKNKLGKTSSNSSMDSGPIEPRTTLSAEDRSKRRAARLLQRASSRELLLQTAASSSEDIGSGSEAGTLRTKPRVMRRVRTQGTRSSTSTQYTATHLHRNNVVTNESRTKERSQRALANSESAVSKPHAVTHPPRKVRAMSEEKHIKQRSVAGTAPTVRCERAERRSLAPPSHSARTSNVLKNKRTEDGILIPKRPSPLPIRTKKKSNTSQSDESVKARK